MENVKNMPRATARISTTTKMIIAALMLAAACAEASSEMLLTLLTLDSLAAAIASLILFAVSLIAGVKSSSHVPAGL